MPLKFFLIKIELGERTHFISDNVPDDLRQVLKSFFKNWTNGPVPLIKVIECTQDSEQHALVEKK